MNKINDGMAKMLKNGVIMDVSSVEEAIIAERSGACAVMALDMIPSKIRKRGGVARMSQISLIKSIKEAVTIPVMAKCRIGHFVEARLLESLQIDFIDESEVLTPADHCEHIKKGAFSIPFVCGARNLGEALRRISEGATMIRTKGEAGTGDISHAIKHCKLISKEIAELQDILEKGIVSQLDQFCNNERVSMELLTETLKLGRLPVVTFAAGGIATPADASLMRHLGVDGIFVGSGIFESSDPEKMAKAICVATVYYDDFTKISHSCDISGTPMVGIDTGNLTEQYQLR
jgi:pyridoxal 5'-phosphate synthase pdxS subunit